MSRDVGQDALRQKSCSPAADITSSRPQPSTGTQPASGRKIECLVWARQALTPSDPLQTFPCRLNNTDSDCDCAVTTDFVLPWLEGYVGNMEESDKAIAQGFIRAGREASADLPYEVAFWLEEATGIVRAQGDVASGTTIHYATTGRTIEQIKQNWEGSLGYCLGFLEAVHLSIKARE